MAARVSVFVVALSVLCVTTAHAERATLTVRSTGRAVTVSFRVGKQRVRCVTPCRLNVPVGSYRARVDGLDRTLDVGPAGSDYTVRPTLMGRRVVGLTLLSLGSLAVGIPACWQCEIDGKARLISVLVGLGLLGLSIPALTSSSAKLLDSPDDPAGKAREGPGHGRRLELEAGTALMLGSSDRGAGRWRITAGASYYPAPWLSLGPRWRLGGNEALDDGHQLLFGARAHVRVPLAYFFVGASVGYGFHGATSAAGRPVEFEVDAQVTWVAPQPSTRRNTREAPRSSR